MSTTIFLLRIEYVSVVFLWMFLSCVIRPVRARWVRGSSSCSSTTATWAEVFSCTAWHPWSPCCSASLTPCFTSPTSRPLYPSSSSDPRAFRWLRWLGFFFSFFLVHTLVDESIALKNKRGWCKRRQSSSIQPAASANACSELPTETVTSKYLS